MKEFSVHPKPQNKRAYYTFYAMLGSAIIAFVPYFALDKYKGIFSFIAMIFIVAAIYIYTRYLSKAYYYDITAADDGEPLFVVRQLVGKRYSTLCRIEIATMVNIEHISRREGNKPERREGVNRYYYLPTMMPEDYYAITVSSPYEKAEVFIEGSDEFAAMLMAYAKEISDSRESIYGDEE